MSDDDPVDDLRAVGMTAGAALTRVAETLVRQAQERAMRQTQAEQQTAREASRRYEAEAAVAEKHYQAATASEWIGQASPQETAATWRSAQAWREVDEQRFGPYADRLTAGITDRYGNDLHQVIDGLGPDGAGLSAEFIEARASRAREAGQERGEARENHGLERAETKEAEQAGTEHSGEAIERGQEARQGAEQHRAAADDLTGQANGYDTPARRERDGSAMRTAGVPAEATEAKMTADHLNGVDPRQAAAQGSTQSPAARGRVQQQTRQRDKTTPRGR